MPTVLIVDNHPIVAEGIRCLLSESDFTILQAATSGQARIMSEICKDTDIMICAYTLMRESDGLDLIKELRRKRKIPVVIYTMYEEPFHLLRIAEAMVDGVALKSEPLQELEHVVSNVLKGERAFSRRFLERLSEATRLRELLSDKANEILVRISSGQSNRDISLAMGLGEKAIEYHRGIILKKLNSRTMAQAIGVAIRLGLIS